MAIRNKEGDSEVKRHKGALHRAQVGEEALVARIYHEQVKQRP